MVKVTKKTESTTKWIRREFDPSEVVSSDMDYPVGTYALQNCGKDLVVTSVYTIPISKIIKLPAGETVEDCGIEDGKVYITTTQEI